MNKAHPGTAVVTGASTGIGAVYADRLARRGYDLVLVARNGERLAAQADRLATTYGRTVRAVAAGLTRDADLRCVEDLLRSDDGITLLVNNAGVGGTGPLLGADVDKMQDMIALNVTALTPDLCRGPRFRGAREGRFHQYRVDRRHRTGSVERRVRRQQGLCARVQPVAAA